MPGLDGTDWQLALLRARSPDVWVDDRLDTTRAHALALGGLPRLTFDDQGEGGSLARANVCGMVPPSPDASANAYRGPDFLVLDERLTTWTPADPAEKAPLLLTFGGSDTHGLTPRILAALGGGWTGAMPVHVITGPAFRHEEALLEALRRFSGEIVHASAVPDLLPLIAGAGMVVCAGGLTAHESAALGRATLVVASEPHEIPPARYLADRGACRYLGYRDEDVEARLEREVRAWLEHPEARARDGAMGRAVVDGRGLERVVAILEACA